MYHPSFLQSRAWADVQAKAGHPALENTGAWQGFRQSLPLGFSYGYFPRVPHVQPEELDQILAALQEHKCVFARIEPVDVLPNSGSFRRVPQACRQPQDTLLVNLLQTEQDIAAQMHQKTRYNIHLAERHGVAIQEEKNPEVFFQLMKQTGARDHFRPHPASYYRILIESPLFHQLTAWYGGKPLASMLLVVHEQVATYVHGASTHDAREVMAPYLLQWAAIRYGKAHGCDQYDFWGIAPPATTVEERFHMLTWQKGHSLSGVTRFKAGFGGTRMSYPDAFDVVLRAQPYQWYTRLRSLARFV